MKENTQEKSLVQINENSIFNKIKNFFKKLFHKDITAENAVIIEDNNEVSIQKDNIKSSFMNSIRNIENEETKLLKLQKQYDNGEIKGEELSEEQVRTLCALYDEQITSLKKSNQIRKQKLLEYRKKLQTDS